MSTSSSIQIRIAGPADKELLADMSRRTFYDTFASANTREDMDRFMEVQFAREDLMREVDVPGNLFLLAYLDGRPAGYAFLCEKTAPAELGSLKAIEIGRIYAEQFSIGKGVGKALMQRSLEIAREKGKEWVWLGVWERNQRAIDFYTKWGFEKFGEHVFIVGFDPQTDWWMKKKL